MNNMSTADEGFRPIPPNPIPPPNPPPAPPLPPLGTLQQSLAIIVNYLKTLTNQQHQENIEWANNTDELTELTRAIQNEDRTLADDVAELRLKSDSIDEKVQAIYVFLTTLPKPNPAASIRMTVTGEKAMAKLGKMKIKMLDNGHLLASVTVLDDAGLPTAWDGASPLGWTASDPGVVPAAAADGLSADLGPSTPPALAKGVIVTAAGTTGRGQSVTCDNSADPIDIEAGPAGSVVMSVKSAA
jgi:hypothetical protein